MIDEAIETLAVEPELLETTPQVPTSVAPTTSFHSISVTPTVNKSNKNTPTLTLPGGSRSEVNNHDILIRNLGPYPYDAPAGFCWVPNGWKLEPLIKTSTPVPEDTAGNFQMLFLDRVKGPTNESKRKRQKLDLRGKV